MALFEPAAPISQCTIFVLSYTARLWLFSKHAVAAATVRFGVVFWAGTRLLHRKRKTHARVDSVASLETMISTTPRAPAAGEALEKVFPTTFPGPREVGRGTHF